MGNLVMAKISMCHRSLRPLGVAGMLICTVAMAGTDDRQAEPSGPDTESQTAAAPHLLDRKMELIMRLYSAIPEEKRDPSILQQLDEAEQLEQSGNLYEAEKLLNQVLLDVGKASRHIGGGRRSSDLQRLRYEEKLTQYDSLWSAMQEILKEKQQSFDAVGNLESLQKRLERSKAYAEEKNYQQANNQIDHAYRLLSQSLSKLRDKETLQHRLVFETPQEEYEYEQRRYQTHQLLLEMTLAEKADPTKLTMAVDRMARAAQEQNLRAQEEASRQDFASAVKTQERATEFLINALRQAGLYLPQ